MSRFIILDANNKVTSVRYGSAPVGDEIESEIGDIRQIRQADGSFIDKTYTDIELQQMHFPKERQYVIDGIVDTQQFLKMTGEVFIEE